MNKIDITFDIIWTCLKKNWIVLTTNTVALSADQAAIFELNDNFKKSKFKIYGNGGFVNLKINDQKLAIQVWVKKRIGLDLQPL